LGLFASLKPATKICIMLAAGISALRAAKAYQPELAILILLGQN
jgi:hypothetical protein